MAVEDARMPTLESVAAPAAAETQSATIATPPAAAPAAATLPAPAAYDWTRIYRDASTLDRGGEASGAATSAPDAATAADWRWLSGCSHSHSDEQRIFDMTPPALLASTAVYRRMGNAYAAEGQHALALAQYQRVLVYVEYCFPDDARQVAAVTSLRATAQLNIAAVHLRSGAWSEAESAATLALSACAELRDAYADVTRGLGSAAHEGAPDKANTHARDARTNLEGCDGGVAAATATAGDACVRDLEEAEGACEGGDGAGEGGVPAAGALSTACALAQRVAGFETKAYYRRAIARRALHRYEEAGADIAAAAARHPHDAAVCAEAQMLRLLTAGATARQRQLAGAMFGGGHATRRARAPELHDAARAGTASQTSTRTASACGPCAGDAGSREHAHDGVADGHEAAEDDDAGSVVSSVSAAADADTAEEELAAMAEWLSLGGAPSANKTAQPTPTQSLLAAR